MGRLDLSLFSAKQAWKYTAQGQVCGKSIVWSAHSSLGMWKEEKRIHIK